MNKRYELKIDILIALYVFVLMLLFINSSPLKNINSKDSATFIAMGRGMLNGKVIYRDLFDHKGLYIFMINCLAAMITPKSLAGLFIIELIFMLASARIVYALFNMYSDSKVSFLGMQIFMFIAIHSRIIEGGNFTEEYLLPFQLCSIYLIARYLKANMKEHPPLYMFIHGVCAGIALMLRPNMTVMWGAIGLCVGIEMLKQRDMKGLVKNFFAGLSGLFISITPVIIYVVVNHIIDEAIFGTFTLNMNYINYDHGSMLVTLISRMLRIILNPGQIILMFMILLSCIFLMRKYRGSPYTIYYLVMLFVSLITVSLSGRKYGHYHIYLLPFVLPFAYSFASWVVTSRPSKYKFAAAAVFAMSLLSGLPTPDSIKLMFGRTILPELPIAQIIEHNKPYYSEDERVLVTGYNPEIYNHLEVTPQEKYFMILGTDYKTFPDAYDEQAASIISGINDVIVIPYGTENGEIYPETGRSEEIKHVLDTQYDLLFYDKASETSMYGKKRH